LFQLSSCSTYLAAWACPARDVSRLRGFRAGRAPRLNRSLPFSRSHTRCGILTDA
jgi:hypothetical protein